MPGVWRLFTGADYASLATVLPTVPHNTVALRVGVEGERLLLRVGVPR